MSTLFPNNTNLQQFQKYVPAGGASNVCNSSVTGGTGFSGDRSERSLCRRHLTFAIPIGDVGFIGPSFQNTLSTANSFDYNISEKDQLRGRLAWVKFNASDTAASLPTFWSTTPQRFWVATLSEYHNFTPNMNNEFRFGFNRFSQVFPVGDQTFPGLTAHSRTCR